MAAATHAVLRGAMEIPLGLVDVDSLKRALTISYQPMGEPEPFTMEAFRVDDSVAGGAIHIPRQFGIDYCNRHGIAYEDDTSLGSPVAFPRVPQPRDYQIEPLAQIQECFTSFYDFVFRARTGFGKTLSALILASRMGVSTLVIVDQENLKQQWVDSLVKHFGFSEGDIGIVQGKKCTYEGKAVTIAMVQTLTQKRFPQKLYDAFGLLVADEVHILGAPTFSSVLLDFSAAYRLGISATPKRRDGLQKLLDYNLGRVRVCVEDAHDPSAVYVTTHDTVYSEYANKSPKIGRFINEVTDDASRNLLVAECAAYLYDTGRDSLVLSDRIEQLVHLQNLCYYMGIPEDEMGVYAGYNLVYGYEKDATPIRRPANLVKHEGDANTTPGVYYTPISLKLISKKSKKADLERIKTTARIIWSTYGKFSKGVDEPRLCGGVDASPRSTSEQVQGRILRKVDGKKTPIWATIADTKSYRSLFGLAGRISDYQKNNSVTYRWSLTEGKVRCDAQMLKGEMYEQVKMLKSLRTGTTSDGLLTLMTGTEHAKHRARSTTTERPPLRSSRTASSRGGRPAK